MVQILLRLSEQTGEWGLVELQGQLETRHQAPLDNMHVGDLHFDLQGTPFLIIGHHLLTGKIVELEKPFAVLQKSHVPPPREPSSPAGEEGASSSALPTSSQSQEGTEYVVVALITRKIIFKNRPKPIITKTLPIKTR